MGHTKLEYQALELFNEYPECRATCYPAINKEENKAELWHTNNRPLPKGWNWVKYHGPSASITEPCPLCEMKIKND